MLEWLLAAPNITSLNTKAGIVVFTIRYFNCNLEKTYEQKKIDYLLKDHSD